MGMPSSKYGGIERFCVELASQLSSKGFHSVFIFESWPESDVFTRDITATGAELHAIPARGHCIHFCIELARILRHYKVYLVHAHFTKARFYAVPLVKVFGIKKVFYTLHSEIEPLYQIKPLTRLWYYRANSFCKIITVSDQIKEMTLDNWPTADVNRIYLGIHPIEGDRIDARRKLNIPENKTIILTIANFNHIKGLDVAVDSISLLKDFVIKNDIELWIIGQPQKDIKDLAAYAKNRGVSNYVKMIGIKNDVSTFICAADIYIQPSRSEGLPLGIMEAMSYGLPIVASNVGGIPEAVVHTNSGLLVSPESPQELADALKTVITNNEKGSELANNARIRQREMFSIKENVQDLINTYQL